MVVVDQAEQSPEENFRWILGHCSCIFSRSTQECVFLKTSLDNSAKTDMEGNDLEAFRCVPGMAPKLGSGGSALDVL